MVIKISTKPRRIDEQTENMTKIENVRLHQTRVIEQNNTINKLKNTLEGFSKQIV